MDADDKKTFVDKEPKTFPHDNSDVDMAGYIAEYDLVAVDDRALLKLLFPQTKHSELLLENILDIADLKTIAADLIRAQLKQALRNRELPDEETVKLLPTEIDSIQTNFVLPRKVAEALGMQPARDIPDDLGPTADGVDSAGSALEGSVVAKRGKGESRT